jgi:hypothetical protein
MNNSLIKLVVYNSHTLGYIFPVYPNDVQILHSSPLKGSPTTLNLTSSFPIRKSDSLRLAAESDFQEFRVSFKGFDNSKEYLYDEIEKLMRPRAIYFLF